MLRVFHLPAQELSREARLLRWIASTDFVDVHQSAMQANKSWPENTAFAIWWQTAEDCVLAHMASFASATETSHLSLHFDGLMVVRDVGRDMEEYVRDVTGLNVELVQETNLCLREAL